MNRLTHQLARDGHLTFRKKCRDLVIQIFGHESLHDQQNLADVAACIVFDIEFYRLKRVRLKDLALRKLLNPFKWTEFLLTVPLELLSWSVQRASGKILAYLHNEQQGIASFSLNIAVTILELIFPFVNLSVNILTGIVRRLIAPVRYIIRPSIELAKTSPKTYWLVFGLTLAITAGLAVSVLAGGLAVFGGMIAATGFGLKVAAVSAAAAVAWACLLKIVPAIPDFLEGFKKWRGLNDRSEQYERVAILNEKKGYDLYYLRAETEPNSATLDRQHYHHVPMLIQYDGQYFIYDAATEESSLLQKIFPSQPVRLLVGYHNQSVEKSPSNTVRIPAKSIFDAVYKDIATYRCTRFREKRGTTGEISRALHAMNPELAEARPVEEQDACYSFALFTGTEALLYPAKKELAAVSVAEVQAEDFNCRL